LLADGKEKDVPKNFSKFLDHRSYKSRGSIKKVLEDLLMSRSKRDYDYLTRYLYIL
jgi:hypothetical protein